MGAVIPAALTTEGLFGVAYFSTAESPLMQ